MWPRPLSGRPVSLKELQLPSIASLRAIAALKSPHLALVRPARIGLGFESAGGSQKTLLEVEDILGGPGRLSLPYSLRWLLDLTAQAFARDEELGRFAGNVSDSGEGRWTMEAAVEEGVPAHVLSAALFQRFSSRGAADFQNRLLSAMRFEFGGHHEKK